MLKAVVRDKVKFLIRLVHYITHNIILPLYSPCLGLNDFLGMTGGLDRLLYRRYPGRTSAKVVSGFQPA